jgi:LysR family transcriptional regulator, salicylic acid-responsive activator of bsdBCD
MKIGLDRQLIVNARGSMLDLKRLRYFCAIIDQGSISKAANFLCIAQPPLSKRLQELEEEIGTPLVIRTARRIAPTEAGYFLYQRAREILRAVEDARQKTIAIAQVQRKVLRVGTSYLYQRYFFPIVRELYSRNPSVEISVSMSDSSHLEQLLQKNIIDVALIQHPLSPEGFELIDLPQINVGAMVASTLMSSPPEVLPLEEVGKLPLILMQRVEGKGTAEMLLDQLRRAGIQPNVLMLASNPATAVEMLENGCEAAVLLPESEMIESPSGRFHPVKLVPAINMYRPVVARLADGREWPEVTEVIQDFLNP